MLTKIAYAILSQFTALRLNWNKPLAINSLGLSGLDDLL